MIEKKVKSTQIILYLYIFSFEPFLKTVSSLEIERLLNCGLSLKKLLFNYLRVSSFSLHFFMAIYGVEMSGRPKNGQVIQRKRNKSKKKMKTPRKNWFWSNIWSCFLLRTPRIWPGNYPYVWWFQQKILHRVSQNDSSRAGFRN